MNVLIILFFIVTAVQSAKILGIFNVASFSHFAPGQTLMNSLVDKGHDVTVIAVYKHNASKFKLVHLNGFVEHIEERKKMRNLFTEVHSSSWVSNVMEFQGFGYELTKNTLEHPNVQSFLKSNQKFDVVIMEQFANEAFRGFCHQFNASCVIYSALPANYWINPLVGNPQNPSYMPQMFLSYVNPMNFLERTYNTITLGLEMLYFILKIIPRQNALMQKHFPDAPELTELMYRTDMIFLNSHESFTDPIPLMPSMVEIGGFHVKLDKLPHDLQKYMDDAKYGVVYFSMGSVLKTRDMAAEKREAFVKAFGKLKQRVLWKFDEDIPGLPENVKVLKWIPQNEVLAHPNTKVFITHGGIFSTIESMYFGVPIIGVPIFGDQESNMAKCKNAGMGITLKYLNATEDNIYEAIRTVLDNERYSVSVKKRSLLMQDRQNKPLDTFTYWIEHLVRHKGANHLRSAALDLSLHQLMLIDVLAFLGFIVTLMACTVLFCVRKLCCQKKIAKVSKDKKKK